MTEFDPRQPIRRGITLLEASAGTGKTHSITDLALQLVIDHGIGIEKILIVTFTEAATVELRDRVRERLDRALGAFEDAGAAGEGKAPADSYIGQLVQQAIDDGSLARGAERLRTALRRFDDAAIFTIHGFCAGVIQEHAFECGAGLDGSLLEDPGALLDEIVGDFWAREVTTLPVDALRMLQASGLRLELFTTLANLIVEEPSAIVEPVAPPWTPFDENDHLWATATELWTTDREKILGAIQAVIAAKTIDGRKWQVRHLASRASKVDGWFASNGEGLASDSIKYFSAAAIREYMKGSAPAPAHPFFDICDDLLELERAAADNLMVLQHRLVEYARGEWTRRKRIARVHSYADMLRIVDDAIHHPVHGQSLATTLGTRWEAALIDEFQDTDPVQWSIFSRIFGNGTDHYLVLIGDPKQAIYSFRGADIETYLAAAGTASERMMLSTNWRSDAAMVDAVNQLFGSRERAFAVDGIRFLPANARHREARLSTSLDPAPLQIQLLPRDGSLLSGGSPGKPGNAADIPRGVLESVLPAVVADDVVRFLESRPMITGADGDEHVVTPRDLAILVRTNRQAALIQQALTVRRVPSVLHSGESVFHSEDAEELDAILAAILQPARQHLTRRALATRLLGTVMVAESAAHGGFDDASDGCIGIGNALMEVSTDEALSELWSERFRNWNALWHDRGVMPMLLALMDDCGLPRRLLALEGGERHMTNLRHLAELLHGAALEGQLGPVALLRWLRHRRADNGAPAEAQQLRLESDADAVRVATIHKSKGLEYPVVWCPYLWYESPATRKSPVVYRREVDGGRGIVVDVGLHSQAGSEGASSDAARVHAENVRLLYVALTRARHRCTIVWGGINKTWSTALAQLLHPELHDSGGTTDSPATSGRSPDDASLHADLDTRARASGSSIAVRWLDLDSPPATTAWTPVSRALPEVLSARRWRRATPLDTLWRAGSFTSLTRSATARAQPDGDEAPEAVADDRQVSAAPATTVDPVTIPLHDFHASARAGIFFHDILERHDFTDAGSLETLVRQRLTAYGFDAARWTPVVTTSLGDVIATPLPVSSAPWRLGDIGTDRRMNELRFEFPVNGGLDAGRGGGLTADSLAQAFASHPGGALPEDYARRLSRLAFSPLRGFLTGAIDLVVERDGRWYVVDYKSNHLGASADDYAPARLSDEMAGAHYFLQYHIYMVALHRYLRWRLPDYDIDRHMGGAMYLFLRGMRPDHGPGHGIFHDAPPAGRILALDALLAGVGTGS